MMPADRAGRFNIEVGVAISMTKATPHLNASWDLMKFLQSKEIDRLWPGTATVREVTANIKTQMTPLLQPPGR